MKLVEIVEKGMAKVNSRRSEETLGDRTEYVGASDLGQCPRKAVIEKLFGTKLDLKTLVRFERGHLGENILAQALEAEGFSPERQVELKGETSKGTPLKFHLDFVFRSRLGTRFAILEAKTSTPVPPFPYESWEMQLYAQMGLARDIYGDRVDIEGAVFALDLAPKSHSEAYAAWNGYKPCRELWENLQFDADVIYQAVQQYKETGNLPADLPCRPGPLCSYCPGLAKCPAFKGERLDDLAHHVSTFLELQNKRKRVADFENTSKEKLKYALQGKGWVGVKLNGSEDNIVKLKVNEKTSTRTDFKALRSALESYGDSFDNYTSQSSYEELLVRGGAGC